MPPAMDQLVLIQERFYSKHSQREPTHLLQAMSRLYGPTFRSEHWYDNSARPLNIRLYPDQIKCNRYNLDARQTCQAQRTNTSYCHIINSDSLRHRIGWGTGPVLYHSICTLFMMIKVIASNVITLFYFCLSSLVSITSLALIVNSYHSVYDSFCIYVLSK